MDLDAPGIDAFCHCQLSLSLLMSFQMSSARQTVVLGPSLLGLGKRPSFTPCHQVDLDTGIGPCGYKMLDKRTKPVLGKLPFDCASIFSFIIFAPSGKGEWLGQKYQQIL